MKTYRFTETALFLLTLFLFLCGNPLKTIAQTDSTTAESDVDPCDTIVIAPDTLHYCVYRLSLPFVYGDSSLSAPGFYTFHYQTVETGCDSTVVVHLRTQDSIITNAVTICSHELPYMERDSALYETKTYSFTVPSSVDGCDSIYFLRLFVIQTPVPAIHGNPYLCSGDSTVLYTDSCASCTYHWSTGSDSLSTVITEAGTYSLTVSSNGCTATDSVVVNDALNPTVSIEGDTSMCIGDRIELVLPDGLSYRWSTGDTSARIQVAPTTDTLFTVTGADSLTHCFSSDTIAVRVHPLPVALISGSPLEICAGDSVLFKATGGVSYEWSSGEQTDSIYAKNDGIYTVVATNEYGCKDTASIVLKVNPLPIIEISGQTAFCREESTTVSLSGAETYIWSNGSTQTSITIATPGIYTVTGTDSKGCKSTASVELTYSEVRASIAERYTYCQGSTVTLRVKGDSTNTYRWDDGSVGDTLVVLEEGTYRVYATNALGCSTYREVIVRELPIPTPLISYVYGSQVICQGGSVTLRASAVGSPIASRYEWNTGATSNTINVREEGVYSVKVTAANGCSAVTSESIIVNPSPEVSILAPSSVCVGNNATLYASCSTGRTFSWSGGQSTQAITVQPDAGTSYYMVTVVDNNNCSATATATLTAIASPSVYINSMVNGSASICRGDTITLTASNGARYQWNNGMTNRTISATTAGIYTVTVYNEGGCPGSSTLELSTLPLPVASITEHKTICSGQTATLTASGSSGYVYSWSNGSSTNQIETGIAGDYTVTVTNTNGCHIELGTRLTVNEVPRVSVTGNLSICAGTVSQLTAHADEPCSYVWSTGDNNSNITVSATGIYRVTAQNSAGCSSTASASVQVHPLPVPQIAGNTSICKGSGTVLTATGGVSYVWSDGSADSQIAVSPIVNSVYTVTAIDQYGCKAGTSATVTVKELPIVRVSGNRSFCAGALTTVTATGGVSYLWSNGAVTSNITVDEAGVYTVTATNASGCQSSLDVELTVVEAPHLSITGNFSICAGTVSQLTAHADEPCSYVWSTGDTNSNITVSATGTYRVTAQNSAGCSSTASASVQVHPLPVPQIAGNTSICKGSGTVLTATGGVSYVWSDGTSGSRISVNPNSTLVYTVTVTDQYGCRASASETVTVKVIPSVHISGTPSFCAGGSTVLTATGGSDYLWSNGANTNSISVDAAGLYAVTATNSNGCQNSASVNVTALDLPVVNVTGKSFVCPGEQDTLTASGAARYVWSTGESGNEILAMPAQTTVYTVTGYAQNGCSSMVSKTVNVEDVENVQINGITEICRGDTTVLTASGGVTYRWGDGSTANSIKVTRSGSYTVEAASEAGCVGYASVAVTVQPTPMLSVSGIFSLCADATTTLTADGGDSYLWSTGSQQNTVTIHEAGTYSVTAYNTYGCVADTTFAVTALPTPQAVISGNADVCAGESGTLTVTEAAQYRWNTGETSQTIVITPTEAADYYVTVTNAYGCVNTAHTMVNVNPRYQNHYTAEICQGESYHLYGFDIPTQDEAGVFLFTDSLQSINGCDSILSLTLTVKPLPVINGTIQGQELIGSYGNYYYYLSDVENANVFEWSISNPHWTLSTSTVNSVFLDVQTSGRGELVVKAVNSCGYKEARLNISCNVGIDEFVNETQIMVYPNPVSQTLNIRFENAFTTPSQVQMLDNAGRCVFASQVTQEQMQIDCTRFAAGVYTLRILDENGTAVDARKVIVRK